MQPLTLQIGMMGHTVLIQQNLLRFQQIQQEWSPVTSIQIIAAPINRETRLQDLDGLLITGLCCPSLQKRFWPLYAKMAGMHTCETLSLWGNAAGAALLGNNQCVSAIDCNITCKDSTRVTTSVLELPGNDHIANRFTAYFLPKINFVNPAPNIGILCLDTCHGIQAVRQGNHLATGFVAELTPQPYIYHYWLNMLIDLKKSRERNYD